MLVAATLSVVGTAGAHACNPTRLDADMRCCLMQTCAERPGSRSVEGAVRSAPTDTVLRNLRIGFQRCQQTDEYNNFLSCARADRKGPYNIGRRILNLPPG
jgi:hypothetical protein